MKAELKRRLLGALAAGATAIGLAGVLVTWYEGRVHTPYLDVAGVLTVCEGITGPDVIPGKTYTDAECDTLRDKHLAIADEGVARQIHVPLNLFQHAALIDYTFHLGETNLGNSTMAKLFNAGDYTAGCEQLMRWVKATVKGKLITLNGLIDRRDAETEMCLHWQDWYGNPNTLESLRRGVPVSGIPAGGMQ